MNHLLIFNLATDADDPILGFTTRWINEFAANVPRVTVLTMYAGRLAVSPNVRVLSAGREHGWSKPRRALRFLRLLREVLAEGDIDGCFSHMMPEFSALGGPLLWMYRVPLVTWYAHPKLNLALRIAHRMSDRMVASLWNAYPYKKDKFVVVGQGIDTECFRPDTSMAQEPMVLCVGRLSRVKNHPVLIRAFRRVADEDTKGRLRLVILGSTPGGDAERYKAELEQLVCELGLRERVVFAPPVKQEQLSDWYRRCSAHVNLTPAGFGDKVAWEAMSCGAVCLVSNTDFAETLGELHGKLMFTHLSEEDLAAKLAEVLSADVAELRRRGEYLRQQVIRLHSLERLGGKIIALLEETRAGSKPSQL